MDIVVGSAPVAKITVKGTERDGAEVQMDMVPLTRCGGWRDTRWCDGYLRHLAECAEGSSEAVQSFPRQLKDAAVVHEIMASIHSLCAERSRLSRRLNGEGLPCSTFAPITVRGKTIIASTKRPYAIKRDLPTIGWLIQELADDARLIGSGEAAVEEESDQAKPMTPHVRQANELAASLVRSRPSITWQASKAHFRAKSSDDRARSFRVRFRARSYGNLEEEVQRAFDRATKYEATGLVEAAEPLPKKRRHRRRPSTDPSSSTDEDNAFRTPPHRQLFDASPAADVAALVADVSAPPTSSRSAASAAPGPTNADSGASTDVLTPVSVDAEAAPREG